MRKLFSVGAAALLTAAVMVAPADAQSMGAFGSCGYRAGDYGLNSLFADPTQGMLNTVPALYANVSFYGVPAPTALGAIVRYGGDSRNDDLNEQRAVFAGVAETSSGSLPVVLRSSTEPSDQGGGLNYAGQSNHGYGSGMNANANGRRGERRNAQRSGSSQSTSDKSGQYIGSAGGLGPGLYTFYVYTGEFKFLPEDIKDGPAGRRFFADEKGYLGTFACAVEDNK
ncbi:MAG: hypothetical protein U0821_18505 [Chloroflexota bacterium]